MAFELTVQVNPASLKLRPGSSASFSVGIHNTGSIVEHYVVDLLGLPAEGMARAPAEPTKLRPRESGEVGVTVALPENSAVRAGTYRIGVRVRSTVRAEVSRIAELAVEVEPVTGVEVSVYPEVIEGAGHGVFTITARNTGNSHCQLSLDVRDERGKARIEVTPPVLAVPPLSQGSAQASVRLPRRLLGSAQQVQVKVSATDSRTPDRRIPAGARMLVTPRIPPGVARALGLVLVVGVTAASILVGGMLAKPEVVPTVAPPIPTAVETSAQGQQPPAAAQIRVEPAAPVGGAKVTFTAKVDDTVEEYNWEIVNTDGLTVSNSTQPSFSPTLDAGSYVVKLTVSSAGGKAITQQPLTVEPKPPPVQIQTDSITLKPQKRANHPVACPEGTIAVAGGFVDEDNTTGAYLRSIRQNADPAKWTISARSPAALHARYIAVCITPPAGGGLFVTKEDAPTQGRRMLTASCPAGQVPYGGGATTGLVNESDDGWVQESLPSKVGGGNWNSWTAVISTQVPTVAIASVYCAPPPTGYQVVDTPVPVAAGTDVVELAATCPAGTLSLGGGAGLANSLAGFTPPVTQLDTPSIANLLVTAPNTDMAGQIDQGWRARVAYSSWVATAVHVVAICAALE